MQNPALAALELLCISGNLFQISIFQSGTHPAADSNLINQFGS
jgi:hypothetical protein